MNEAVNFLTILLFSLNKRYSLQYTQILKYSNTQILKYSNTQILKYSNTQILKYSNWLMSYESHRSIKSKGW